LLDPRACREQAGAVPTFYSGVELIAEDYLAGGLYFYVLGRHRLELAPDGTAKLCLELVHESWFEPYELDIGATWRGAYGPRDLELENEVHGKVRVSMQTLGG
jgi:hypothetical protein